MPGRPHNARWAEEVEQEEAHDREEDEDQQGSPLYDELSGQYCSRGAGAWQEGMDVERGQSKQRLDLSHGFMRSIVRCCLLLCRCACAGVCS
jgi:hypothetical protein